MNINNITERPFEKDVQKELQDFEVESRAMLRMDVSVTEPDDIVRAPPWAKPRMNPSCISPEHLGHLVYVFIACRAA